MDREAWRATGSQRVQHNLVTNSSTGYYMQLACRCFSSLLTGALSTVFCPSCCSTWQGQPLGDGGIHRRSCARDSHLCPPATPTFRASPSGGDWKNHSHLFIQLTLSAPAQTFHRASASNIHLPICCLYFWVINRLSEPYHVQSETPGSSAPPSKTPCSSPAFPSSGNHLATTQSLKPESQESPLTYRIHTK